LRFYIKWSEETFLEGAKLYYDYTLKNSKKRMVGWVFIAILQFGIVMAIKQGTIGMLLLGSFLSFYWYFLRWPLRKKALKMQFKKSPMANKDMSIEISKQNIKIDDNELKFDKINEVIESEKGFLLAIDNGFIYLPLKNFTTESKKIFTNILQEKVGIKKV